ncbi:MAG: hypothetical protein CVU05_15625 [Bacteroidetes bacterium HGW-Bacteroidetes-21]|nr:MAG: hypothetical protein CVU05_15625 [Bacteroidetes bacterium HGW-Bacteroidetes-21]
MSVFTNEITKNVDFVNEMEDTMCLVLTVSRNLGEFRAKIGRFLVKNMSKSIGFWLFWKMLKPNQTFIINSLKVQFSKPNIIGCYLILFLIFTIETTTKING